MNWNKVIQGALVTIVASAVLSVGALIWNMSSAVITRWIEPPYSQRLTWLSETDGNAPGIRVWGEDKDHEKITETIPWTVLRIELERNLLPKLFNDYSGFRFDVQDFHGKKNWVVKLVEADGKGFGYLWLGINPDKGWEFDGLVRLGGDRVPHVWQTNQRYSNGTYRRLSSAFHTLEEACGPADRPCITE